MSQATRGIKSGWLAALVVACGLGASTASAQVVHADSPLSLQIGDVVFHSAQIPKVLAGGPSAEFSRLRPPLANIPSRRDALRACVQDRSNCIEIADLDSFDSGDPFGLTPKMIQACAEKTGGKVIDSFGEKARKSQITETDLSELLRKCHPGVI